MKERINQAEIFAKNHLAERSRREQDVFERLGVVNALDDVKEFWGEGKIGKGADGTGLVLVSYPFLRIGVSGLGFLRDAAKLEIRREVMIVGVNLVDTANNVPLSKAEEKLRLYRQGLPLYGMETEKAIGQAGLNKIKERNLVKKLSDLTEGGILIGRKGERGELEIGHIHDPDAADRFNFALVNMCGDTFVPDRVRKQQERIIELLPPNVKQKLMIPFTDNQLERMMKWLPPELEQDILAHQVKTGKRRIFGSP